jgi:hypothetical protein
VPSSRGSANVIVREELTPIQTAIDRLLSSLSVVKISIEQGQIPFVERDYFNLAVAMEKIQEARERLAGILKRNP